MTGVQMAKTQETAAVLVVKNLGKEYKLYDSPRQRVKALLTGRAMHRSHWALRDVSFSLARGQCIGVVGDNGAGKSSLLKLLAGTMQPSTGSIERSGRITAILELGAGFHPDFSGRDNLYFAGSLIGISHEEMRKLEPEIIAFSELQDAIDRPVKTYSSGMNVRLAFALVTAVQPDVLIVDEALAVGDQSFQKKCIERILDFRQKGCTILFCSHSPYHIRHLCDAALWLEQGQVQMFGETEAVLAAYDVRTRQKQDEKDRQQWGDDAASAVPSVLTDVAAAAVATEPADPLATPYAVEPPNLPPAEEAGNACILSVDIANLSPGDPPVLQGQDLVITIKARGNGAERPNIGFMIEQNKGVGIACLATHEEGAVPLPLPDGSWQSVLSFPDLPLHSGDYVVSAFLFDGSGLAVYDQWFQYTVFRFIYPKPLPGLVRLPHHWS
ncbi:ABC transporter ATP-binding protein [Comamonas sp.]|uniref:ABC transporter ATP-binding protein n=1 Tax=Comamonas sp. TaxID=34028 RepID=UPI003D0F813F